MVWYGILERIKPLRGYSNSGEVVLATANYSLAWLHDVGTNDIDPRLIIRDGKRRKSATRDYFQREGLLIIQIKNRCDC